MGSLRLLLATAVVFGHLSIFWDVQNIYAGFVNPYFPVQIFFVISGFYIALVLHEKYQTTLHGVREFYWQRYWRLAPVYWIILLISLICLLMYPQIFVMGQILQSEYQFTYSLANVSKTLLLLFSNSSMFGLDLAGHFSFYEQSARWFLLVPQAWSLSMELLFYLCAPWLVKQTTKLLIILCCLCFASRFVLYAFKLPFWPWQQCFFFSECMFFIFGILSYRGYLHFKIQQFNFSRYCGFICAGLLGALIATASYIAPRLNNLTAWNSLFFGLITLATIPFIFSLTRYSKWDRILGELSYPVYLSHILLGYLCQLYLELCNGFFLLLIAVVFAIPMRLYIEIPLHRLRTNYAIRHRKNIVSTNSLNISHV